MSSTLDILALMCALICVPLVKGVTENILEFDSHSSDECPPQSPVDHPHVHFSTLHTSTPVTNITAHPQTSTPVTKITSHPHTSTPAEQHVHHYHQQHLKTVRDFCSHLTSIDLPVTTPTPEYQSIVTPPSSPEATPPSKRSEVKQTTSEWLRQIPLEVNDLTSAAGVDETVLGLNETVLRGLSEGVGSVRRERGGRRRRGRRVVTGGLAAAVEMLEQREASEIAFWEHRARNMDDSSASMYSIHKCRL